MSDDEQHNLRANKILQEILQDLNSSSSSSSLSSSLSTDSQISLSTSLIDLNQEVSATLPANDLELQILLNNLDIEASSTPIQTNGHHTAILDSPISPIPHADPPSLQPLDDEEELSPETYLLRLRNLNQFRRQFREESEQRNAIESTDPAESVLDILNEIQLMATRLETLINTIQMLQENLKN